MTPTGTPIEYPTITVGGKNYALRLSMAAHYQISVWQRQGYDTSTTGAWAAAAAGNAAPDGSWSSLAPRNPVAFMDMFLPGEGDNLIEAVAECLKKALPAAINQQPATTGDEAAS